MDNLAETKLIVATSDFSNDELTKLLRASSALAFESETEEDYQERLLDFVSKIKKRRNK